MINNIASKDNSTGLVANDKTSVLKSLKVLVVEDNPMNQKFIKRILDAWGCTYQLTHNGLESIRATNEVKYDIIFMDIHMPEMDGLEATIEIRSQVDNPNQSTPVIALTAAAMLNEKEQALDSGMNDFLTKPFTSTQIEEVVFKWLNPINGSSIGGTQSSENEVEEADAPMNFDLSILQKISRGNHVFIKEMIEEFLNNVPASIEKMRNDFVQKNYEGLYFTAHRIKSNFRMLGMIIPTQLASDVEVMIKSNLIDEVKLSLMLDQIKESVAEACPQLERKLLTF